MFDLTYKYISRVNKILDANTSKSVSNARYSMYKNLLFISLAVSILLIAFSISYHFFIKDPIVIENVKIHKVKISAINSLDKNV